MLEKKSPYPISAYLWLLALNRWLMNIFMSMDPPERKCRLEFCEKINQLLHELCFWADDETLFVKQKIVQLFNKSANCSLFHPVFLHRIVSRAVS